MENRLEGALLKADQFVSIQVSPTNITTATMMGIERRLRGLDLPFLLFQKSFHRLYIHIVQLSLNSFGGVCVFIYIFKLTRSLLVQLKFSKHLKNCIWLDKLLSFETITVHCIKLSGILSKTEIWLTSLSHFNFYGSVYQLVFQKSNKRV